MLVQRAGRDVLSPQVDLPHHVARAQRVRWEDEVTRLQCPELPDFDRRPRGHVERALIVTGPNLVVALLKGVGARDQYGPSCLEVAHFFCFRVLNSNFFRV